jgi:hypothetical protein
MGILNKSGKMRYAITMNMIHLGIAKIKSILAQIK